MASAALAESAPLPAQTRELPSVDYSLTEVSFVLHDLSWSSTDGPQTGVYAKMPRKKKRTEEQIKKSKREAEKRRRARIKADPIKNAEYKTKEKERRQKRKETKKTKTIADLTPREQRMQRNNWREAQKKSRQLTKIHDRCLERLREETPPSDCDECVINDWNQNEPADLRALASPSSPSLLQNYQSPSSLSASSSGSTNRQKIVGSRIARKNKTAKDRLIEQQKQTIALLKKKIHSLAVKNSRLEKETKNSAPFSPKLQRYRRNRFDVQRFLKRDENSKLCPGKKDTITRRGKKKQKRYLCDTLKNLHSKYVKESNKNMSYATFTRFRPFWIVPPKIEERDTCLCVTHANFDYVVSKLKEQNLITERSVEEICDVVVCSKYNFKCMMKKCQKCINKTLNFATFDNSEPITYKQWITKTEERKIKGIEKKIKRTVKVSIESTKKKMIEKFLDILPKYLKHKFNIWQQYQAINQLKKELRFGDALLHCDFSENYQCKYAQEAQSVHFGASRQQLSLHTCVLYYKNVSGNIQTVSFCSVSECLRHDAAAVYAHLKRSLKELMQDKNLTIQTLHVLSDGPTMQYKNKSNFYLFTHHLVLDLNIKTATWNFSEASHGKGAADGVGAVVKRTADSLVAHGDDIPDFLTFVTKIVCRTNILLYTINESDINNADTLLPKTLKTVPETYKLHQITWNCKQPEKIMLRQLSCFKCPLEAVCKHFSTVKGYFEYSEVPRQSRSLKRKILVPQKPIEVTKTRKDEQETILDKDKVSPKVGSWVVVKFEGKKTILHFVGQIMSIDDSKEEIMYIVKFLRKRDLDKGIFAWPEPEDVSLVAVNDIMCLLPEPTPTRRGEIIIIFDFLAKNYKIM